MLEICKWTSDDDYYIDDDIDEFFIENNKIVDGLFELEEYREEKIYDTLEQAKEEFNKIKESFS